MLDRIQRNIAKEIVDQTLNHFKKQQQVYDTQQQVHVTREQSSIREAEPKVERGPEERYETSANFNRIFSGITGEKSQIEKKEAESESKIKSTFEIDSRKAMSNEPVYHEQQHEPNITQNSHMENKRDEPTATASVFRKLSQGTKNG